MTNLVVDFLFTKDVCSIMFDTTELGMDMYKMFFMT